MSSGSGSGADQHLLALLRAIRLRQAAPDAVAAGVADAAAALAAALARSGHAPGDPAGLPDGGSAPDDHSAGLSLRPSWARPEPSDGDAVAPAEHSGETATNDPGAAEGPATPDAASMSVSSREHGPQLRPAGLRSADAARPPAEPVPHRVVGLETPVAAAGRAGAATDGMDPADDELLRETRRQLSTSLTFAGGPTEVAERFRQALLQAQSPLLAALPGNPSVQADLLAKALTWLVHHLDQPPVLVAGCGALGVALAERGVLPEQLRLVGAALVEAVRAGMPPGSWRQEFDLAWRSTWQHAYEWIVHGETSAGHEAGTWAAAVVDHELRRPDLAVLKLRPFLPMPLRAGQYARIEVSSHPGLWRPYSLVGRPRRDDVLELHVRAKTAGGISDTLVHHTKVGDRVRLGRAEGEMVLSEPPGRDLLMIAGDTGVAPMKALLGELADTRDPRSAVLFWGVRDLDELYDFAEISEIARAARRATVVPVVSEGDPGAHASGLVTDAVAAYGQWAQHEVFLAGPPLMVAATAAALHQLGVDPERIHHDPPA